MGGYTGVADVVKFHTKGHGADHGRQVDALEQAPHQGQATVDAQVIGQFLDNELDWVSHMRRLHLLSAWKVVGNALIINEKSRDFGAQVTDSGS